MNKYGITLKELGDAYDRDFDHKLNDYFLSLLNEMAYPIAPERLRAIFAEGDTSLCVSVLEHPLCPNDIYELARKSNNPILMALVGVG